MRKSTQELVKICRFLDNMKSAMRQVDPSISDEILEAFADYCLPEFVKLFEEMYTEEEIEQLIQFHSSAVGQKGLNLVPTIMIKSMEIGQNAAEAVYANFVANKELPSTLN